MAMLGAMSFTAMESSVSNARAMSPWRAYALMRQLYTPTSCTTAGSVSISESTHCVAESSPTCTKYFNSVV